MAKNPTRSRLSIVLPIGQDTKAFENSLVSILEHMPSGCEVIVAHDGHYDDPFDLGDEVQFVTTDSASPLDLISSGVACAKGRFVHILAGGLTATADWVDAALEKFEHANVAAVAPVVRHAKSGKIIAAGWHDHATRLCQPSCAAATKIDRKEAARIDGCFLEASFWRRDTIEDALKSYLVTARDADHSAILEASYCAGLLTKQADWRSMTAAECEIVADEMSAATTTRFWSEPSFRRGQRLAAIRKRITGKEASFAGAACTAMTHVFRPRRMMESLGQGAGRSAAAEMERRIRLGGIASREDVQKIIPLPSERVGNLRHAA